MERFRVWFNVVLVVCWLTVVGQQGVLLSSDSHAVAGSAQTSAPADDNDDQSDDGTLADDFTIQSRRIEVAVPLQLVLRVKPHASPARIRRETTAFNLPHIWQFIERAAAVPRAPTCVA
jgi:hypothetical protein